MYASLSILSTCLILRQGSDNWSSTGSRQSSRFKDQRFLEGVVDAGDDDVAAGDDDDNFDLPPSTLLCPSLC